MDYGVTLPKNRAALKSELERFFPGITEDEAARRMARGRNNWIVWTGGNDRFWSHLTGATLGGFDLLKTISDEPTLPATRSNRWEELGLVNEPCYEKATGPREDRWGLWLPKRIPGCGAPDPFENEGKYPGVKIGSRGTNVVDRNGKTRRVEVGSFYGYSTGVVGLRLFPNPDFDQKAAERWDADRFYRDEKYFTNPKLVRPYRVGMACAFCHVGPNPSNPPANFNAPNWENLSSNPGAQYFWFDRVFYWNYRKHPESFVFQLLHVSRPGALDTSLVSSDQIANPRTMNAVYSIAPRVAVTQKFGLADRLTGAELLNHQFNGLTQGVPANSPLRKAFTGGKESATILTPKVLKDGSDSVGMLGALNRVYVNIGLFSEEWLKHFIPLIGGPKITPFPIEKAEKNSLYWKANVAQTPDLALFFLGSAKPDKLAAAPGGSAYLGKDSAKVELGKTVFAENCAGCHSSKLPEKAYSFFNRGPACEGPGYPNCWNSYWDYVRSPEFKSEMRKIAQQPDFLESNYLSTELRVPVNVVGTNLCSPIATNAIEGDIWDNFSSTTYKSLDSVGDFRVNYPSKDGGALMNKLVKVPGGGRGYIRPPSLISLWSTAPFLQNNSLGRFDLRGTVEGRMKSFDDSIDKLLNPEKRATKDEHGKRSMTYVTQFGDKLKGTVDVTPVDTYAQLPKSYVPGALRVVFDLVAKVAENEAKAPNRYAYEPLTIVRAGPPKNTLRQPIAPKREPSWLERSIASVKGIKLDSSKAEATRVPAAADEAEDDEVYYNLGPIPAGVPVNLVANLDLKASVGTQLKAVTQLVTSVLHIRKHGLKGEEARKYFMEHASGALLKASKCPDFVVDSGHYFGTAYSQDVKNGLAKPLTAEEKSALIEFLKRL
jgi:hypothetical protein